MNSRRGQALVESALVTIVFLTLLIGILDVGQVLFVHQTLVERTRAALRYGAVRPFDADAIRNLVLYNQTTAPAPDGMEDGQPEDENYEPIVIPGLFGLTPSMVEVSRQGDGAYEDRIVIRISNYPFTFYTPFIAGAYRGKPLVASMPYEVM